MFLATVASDTPEGISMVMIEDAIADDEGADRNRNGSPCVVALQGQFQCGHVQAHVTLSLLQGQIQC